MGRWTGAGRLVRTEWSVGFDLTDLVVRLIDCLADVSTSEVCARMHSRAHTHAHTHTHTHTRACAHTHIHTRTHIHTHTETHTRARARAHTHTHTHSLFIYFTCAWLLTTQTSLAPVTSNFREEETINLSKGSSKMRKKMSL